MASPAPRVRQPRPVGIVAPGSRGLHNPFRPASATKAAPASALNEESKDAAAGAGAGAGAGGGHGVSPPGKLFRASSKQAIVDGRSTPLHAPMNADASMHNQQPWDPLVLGGAATGSPGSRAVGAARGGGKGSPGGGGGGGGGDLPPVVTRERSTSHYDRMNFGAELDPAEELRRKLEAKSRRKAEADAAAEAERRQREEEESRSGLFGWIGAAIKKPTEAPSVTIKLAHAPPTDDSSDGEGGEGGPADRQLQRQALAVSASVPPNKRAEDAAGDSRRAHQHEKKKKQQRRRRRSRSSSSSGSRSRSRSWSGSGSSGSGSESSSGMESGGRSRSGSGSSSSGSGSGSGSRSDSSSSDSEAERGAPMALADTLQKKEVLALPSVESTLRMMARGAYFTFYYVSDAPAGTNTRTVANLSVHAHRRISTFESDRNDKGSGGGGGGRGGGGRHNRGGGGGGGGDDDDDDPYSSGGSGGRGGVNPFFVPPAHTRPVVSKDVFLWCEFPGAVVGKLPPDTVTSANKDARGRAIKNQRLSNVRGAPEEQYSVHSGNYLSFLRDASLHWCEASKPPTAPKDSEPWDGVGEDPFPTRMPHPRREKMAHRARLSHPHQLRIKKEDQRLSVLDIVDLYTGKKSLAFLSASLAPLSPDHAFTIASRDSSISLATDVAHNYMLLPWSKALSRRRQAALLQLDIEGLKLQQASAAAKTARAQSRSATAQRDAWLLGFASLLSVGRNLVKHRIERSMLPGGAGGGGGAVGAGGSDKALKIARTRNRKKVKAFASLPRLKGALLVRDAASVVRTGVYAKRYYVESRTSNDMTDERQEKTTRKMRGRPRASAVGAALAGGEDDEGGGNSLDSVRRVLHYEEVFVWVDFPNDPDVRELPDAGVGGAAAAGLALGGSGGGGGGGGGSSGAPTEENPMVRPGGGGLRAQRGGMSDEDEEVDMYGAAFYWCEPAESVSISNSASSASRPRNPAQAVFFSQLEDIYVGKKTEAFVFDHVDPSLCLSLYTPTVVLDLQFDSEGVRNLWIKSIVALLQLHRIIGAARRKDAQLNHIDIPQQLVAARDRKLSQPGLTPVWLHHRSMSRDSLYGSLPLFREGETPHLLARHTRSPSWTPITPLMLPSPFGAAMSPIMAGAGGGGGGGGGGGYALPPDHSRHSSGDSDSSPPDTGGRPLFIRKISDLDLTRPSSPALKAMVGHGGGAGSMGGNDHLIIVEEDEDDEK